MDRLQLSSPHVTAGAGRNAAAARDALSAAHSATSVAIVSYNTRTHLRACLETVVAEQPREVVVVDNGSSDGSVEMVQRAYPQVILQINHSNCGYGAALNQAVTICNGPYVLLLNSDTRVDPGALRALSEYLELHPQVAIVGPRLLNPDRSLQASCYPFPTPLNLLLEESTLGRYIACLPVLRQRYLRTWPHTNARTVPWVLGAAFAIRRAAFEAVGGFDPSFFMYYEEVDLCWRLQAAGWEVHFAPTATIIHIGGASAGQYRPQMLRQVFASAAHFYRRHYSRRRMLQLRVVVVILMLARIVRDLVQLLRVRDTIQRSCLYENMLVWHAILRDVRFGWNVHD